VAHAFANPGIPLVFAAQPNVIRFEVIVAASRGASAYDLEIAGIPSRATRHRLQGETPWRVTVCCGSFRRAGLLTMERIRSDQKALRRRFPCVVRRLAVALVMLGCAFSAPAVACLCSCSIFSTPGEYPIKVSPTKYEQVFSGLVISTGRTGEPVVAPPIVVGKTASGETIVEDPGYWIRSRVLVLRVWRGTPSMVAEVWTPNLSDCDVPLTPGFHFVALVRTEKGRSVAHNTYCDCVEKDAWTQGRGTFTGASIALAASLGAAAIALLWLVKVVRRRGPPG
jgi:hypothetical protein